MKIKNLVLLLLCAVLIACEATIPTLQSGPNAEVTFDGLVRVDNARMDIAWIRPGIDLSGYNQLMLVGAGIKYRSVREVNRLNLSRDSEFPLDARQRERIVLLDEMDGGFFSESLVDRVVVAMDHFFGKRVVFDGHIAPRSGILRRIARRVESQSVAPDSLVQIGWPRFEGPRRRRVCSGRAYTAPF